MSWRLVWVAALGALQTLAFVHTTWLWWLPIVAVVVLVTQINGATPSRAALLGLVFGSAWLCAGVWWLFISLHHFGGLPAWLAVMAVLLLAVALSLYLAVAAAAYAAWRSGRPLLDAALFAALWLLTEWARGVIFTGFPWLASGYSQVDSPLAALLPWVGVYGVGAVLAFLGAYLGAYLGPYTAVYSGGSLGVLSAKQRRATPGQLAVIAAAGIAVFVVPTITGPAGFSSSAGVLRVALIQTNVAQDEKFAVERMPAALAWLSKTLHEARADLVVAPETAVPLLPNQLTNLAPGWWEALQAHFAEPGRAALVGLPLGSFDAGYTNSVVGLKGQFGQFGQFGPSGLQAAPAFRYDKHHLVPFGEFIPTGFRWFTELMNIPLGDFARGPVDAPSFTVGAQRVAPNICYEDLFGEELAVRFVDAAKAPTMLANVSNIGWFGDTVAIPQHLNITRVRTLEFQRPMLRATNTGATAIADHRGRVTHQLLPYTRGVLEAEVEGRNGITPFAWWAGRFGLWPLVGLALVVIAAVRFSRWRGPADPAAPA